MPEKTDVKELAGLQTAAEQAAAAFDWDTDQGLYTEALDTLASLSAGLLTTAEIEGLPEQRASLEPGPEHRVIENRLADLQAEFEMAEKDRMAIALAITGFTILSPEQRAREIVRQSIFEDIEEHISVHDYYRARAGVQFALRYYDGDNIFDFSEEDHDFLLEKLDVVEGEIEEIESAALESADAATAGIAE